MFVIGNHAAPLYNIVSYNIYERLLGLTLTPWSERQNTIRLKNKEAGKTARAKAGGGRVAGTRPSHKLDDYAGEFEHPAYGVLTVSKNGESLTFDFHMSKSASEDRAARDCRSRCGHLDVPSHWRTGHGGSVGSVEHRGLAALEQSYSATDRVIRSHEIVSRRNAVAERSWRLETSYVDRPLTSA